MATAKLTTKVIPHGLAGGNLLFKNVFSPYLFRICYDDDVKVIALPYPTLSHNIVCISSLFCDVFVLFNDPFALSI